MFHFLVNLRHHTMPFIFVAFGVFSCLYFDSSNDRIVHVLHGANTVSAHMRWLISPPPPYLSFSVARTIYTLCFSCSETFFFDRFREGEKKQSKSNIKNGSRIARKNGTWEFASRFFCQRKRVKNYMVNDIEIYAANWCSEGRRNTEQIKQIKHFFFIRAKAQWQKSWKKGLKAISEWKMNAINCKIFLCIWENVKMTKWTSSRLSYIESLIITVALSIFFRFHPVNDVIINQLFGICSPNKIDMIECVIIDATNIHYIWQFLW